MDSLQPIPPTSPAESISDGRRAPRRTWLWAGASLLVAGFASLVIAAQIDERARARDPWAGALFAQDGDPPWDGAVRMRSRHIPINNVPLQRDFYMNLRDRFSRETFRSLGLDETEWFLSIDLPPDAFAPLLDSGRLPRKGTDEVLAGAFARPDYVQLDDGAFRVVGRLKRNTAALATAYVLPADDVWEPLWFSTALLGWFDPHGKEKLRALDDPEAFAERNGVQFGATPAPVSAVYATIFGLVLVACGGGLIHQGLFRALAARSRGPLAPAFRCAAAHPRLAIAMHLMLYGVFFAAMLPAILQPFTSVLMQKFLEHVFSEAGQLGYVGAAYASGHILSAAFSTWINNFLLQTAAYTYLVSLVVPMSGVLKTALSFGVTGLAMAPIWSGLAGVFVFHSITMLLELEAYIYACVAVCAFWVRVARAIGARRAPGGFGEAVRMLGSSLLLSGLLLAIAATYEAATLLLLR